MGDSFTTEHDDSGKEQALPDDPQHGSQAKLALPERARLRAIVHACHARLGRPLNVDDLEDAVQDVHVKAWRSLDTFRGDSSIDTWIYGIARLSILHSISRRNRVSNHETAFSPDAPDPVDLGTRPGSRFDSGFREAVRNAMRIGSGTIEKIYEAHDMNGETFGQIGESLGMSEPAVKSRYYRSLDTLKRQLFPLWASLRR